MNPTENLANAIVLQAVKDYRKAQRRLKKNQRDADSKATCRECERFFRSQWFQTLTSIDGEVLLAKLKEEVA